MKEEYEVLCPEGDVCNISGNKQLQLFAELMAAWYWEGELFSVSHLNMNIFQGTAQEFVEMIYCRFGLGMSLLKEAGQ